jgi:hypothetical protein
MEFSDNYPLMPLVTRTHPTYRFISISCIFSTRATNKEKHIVLP